jgi:hypothetical protein
MSRKFELVSNRCELCVTAMPLLPSNATLEAFNARGGIIPDQFFRRHIEAVGFHDFLTSSEHFNGQVWESAQAEVVGQKRLASSLDRRGEMKCIGGLETVFGADEGCPIEDRTGRSRITLST